ncbi:hypothetical protein, partial [Streptomyces sp. 1222.5]|uniref:hypothetical protein n=1 Tax=Streptomyces sp. 1222.5 TaxID=1881026 RepID=UPI003D747956
MREHLTRLLGDTSWGQGPTPQLGSRLVQAANEALRRTLGEAASRVPVNAAAARERSVTLDPT